MTVFGCSVTPLDEAASMDAIRELLGERPATAGHRWLLAHCDGGVVWGRREGEAWVLSAGAFPGVSPLPAIRAIQQLRLFGSDRELLVWRTQRDPEPRFRGREISEQKRDAGHPPLREELILVGDRLIETRGGFSLIGDATGSRHAVPFLCREEDFVDERGGKRSPLRLRVHHYVAEVPARAPGAESSGALRIAATRLCGIVLHGKEVE